MKKAIIVVISLLIAFFASSQKKYSLNECFSIAFKSNRTIKQAELALIKSRIELKEARNNLLPQINAEANHNWSYPSGENAINSTTSYWGFNSNIQLFDGLKSIYEIKYRKNELAISDLNVLYQNQLIRDEVTSLYLKILLNEELKTVSLSQLQLTDSLIIQRKIRYSQGRISQGELLELYAQRAKEEYQCTQAGNNLLISKLELTQLLEMEFDSLFAIEGLDIGFLSAELSTKESVYDVALKSRANIKSAELQSVGNKLTTAIIKSRYLPNVTAGVVGGENYINRSVSPFSTRIYIMASVPIFDRFETRNLLQKSKVQTKLSDLNLLNEKKELFKLIEHLKYNSLASKTKWESAIKSVNISIDSYNYLKSKYESGKSTVYELYQAKTNLLQQNSAALQAKYEYYFQLKMIQNLMN